MALLIALQMVCGFLLGFTGVFTELPEDSPLFFVINVYIIPVVTWALVILYGLWRSESRWSDLWSEKTKSVKTYIIVLMMFTGLSVVVSEINNYIRYFYPMTDFWKEIFQNIYRADIWLSFFGIAIIPPVLEEIVFRGIILKGFLNRFNTWVAIGLSSFLFAVIHLNIWQFATAFIAGFFLGWVFYKTGSLFIVIFSHVVVNVIAVLGNHYTSIPGFTDGAPFQPAWLTLSGLGLIIVSLLLLNFSKTGKTGTSSGTPVN